MIKLIEKGVYFSGGKLIRARKIDEQKRKGTISYKILSAHNQSGDDKKLKVIKLLKEKLPFKINSTPKNIIKILLYYELINFIKYIYPSLFSLITPLIYYL